jgi:predicted Zn-dependent protease
MKQNRLSRAACSLALAATLWTLALVPASRAQEQTPAQTSTSTATQQTGATQQTANAQPTPTPTPVHPRNNAPLKEDEDPSKIGQRNINKGLIAKMAGKPEKDIALGRQLAAEVEKEAKFIDDPVITEYINRVGQNIVLHSDAKVPFTIKVIDSDEVNAFALPGGFFYVNKGLILAADNEAELAGVMAHETAHVAARHTAENIAKANLYQYGALAAVILGMPPILLNASDFTAMLAFLKYSRGAEAEADKLGLQYMYAAGYDPNAMATMFEKLSALNKKKPGRFARLFQTHPYAPERREAAVELAARFPPRDEYIISTSEFQRVKARLLRMSNATKATAAIPGKDDNNGRPTLKRRNPTPDDQSNPNGTSQPTTPSDRPTLKRSPNSSDTSTQTPPNNP